MWHKRPYSACCSFFNIGSTLYSHRFILSGNFAIFSCSADSEKLSRASRVNYYSVHVCINLLMLTVHLVQFHQKVEGNLCVIFQVFRVFCFQVFLSYTLANALVFSYIYYCIVNYYFVDTQ